MIQCTADECIREAKTIFLRRNISNFKYVPRILPVIALLVASGPSHGAAIQAQGLECTAVSDHSVCSAQNERSVGSDTLSKNGQPVANVDVVDLKKSSNAFNVLDNDSDPDGDSLVLTYAQAKFGAVAFTPEGLIGYAQNPGQPRSDKITYVASDGHGGFAEGTVEIIAR